MSLRKIAAPIVLKIGMSRVRQIKEQTPKRGGGTERQLGVVTRFRQGLERLFRRNACPCALDEGGRGRETPRQVLLVGTPNVGKSVLFKQLTGVYATVSNYPGTTVEITRGKMHVAGQDYEIIDTPGMYTLLPITEEERVARNLLMSAHPYLVLHVMDAKDLDRMLPLSLQLIEADCPLLLVLNMVDEAETAGVTIDTAVLEEETGVPVVATVAPKGYGLDLLKERIAAYGCR